VQGNESVNWIAVVTAIFY